MDSTGSEAPDVFPETSAGQTCIFASLIVAWSWSDFFFCSLVWKEFNPNKFLKLFDQQIQELEAEFDKLGNEKVVQTRFLRSQQELKAKIEAQADEEEEEGM